MTPMSGRVRTLDGDVEPSELGIVDYHDHLFQVTPLLPGDELADEARSAREAGELVAAGVGCMVEATPLGLGRRPRAARRISRERGLHVVHTTGVHREAHYPDNSTITSMSIAAMHDLFRDELTVGFEERTEGDEAAPPRAGLLKFGIGYWAWTKFERRALEAVAQVSAELGAPVMVHLEHGSATHEVLSELEGLGCPPTRVALAHIDRNPDPGLHLELAARGAFLGYDGCARYRDWPESTLIECVARVVDGGGGEQVLVGGDVARSTRYVAYGGMPGLAYTYSRYVPRLRSTIGPEACELIIRSNPARWLTWAPQCG